MYELGSRYQDTNGYILVYEPAHPKAMKSGAFSGYVYEHVLVAESILERSLTQTEEVHHLDFNKSNNSPDNLLIMLGPMHAKLHMWLKRHALIPNERQEMRNALGCVRCKVCEIPIHPDAIFCDSECMRVDRETVRLERRPSREDLQRLVWEKPTTHLAKEWGVSDVAFANWCKQEGVSKPPRGYWAKVNATKLVDQD